MRFVVAVLAMLVAACSGSGSGNAARSSTTVSRRSVAGVSTTPAGMRQASLSGVSFDYPTRLHLHAVSVNEHYVVIIAYVSNQRLRSPCTPTSDAESVGVRCGLPLTHLASAGVLVTWSFASSVGGVGNLVSAMPGQPRIVGGHDAKLIVTSGPGLGGMGVCAPIGGVRSIEAIVRMQAFAVSDTTLDMEACLGRSALSQQSEVLAMLNSVRFPHELTSPSISCPGTAARTIPHHQRPGTTSALVPGEPIALLACRYHGYNQRQGVGTLATAADLSASVVARELNASRKPLPGEVSNCVIDFGETYELYFVYSDGPPLLLRFDHGGCQTVTNGDLTDFPPVEVARQLEAALGSDRL